ncbi:MAG: histidine phosphatase family protein [Gammaproteobacteria bacterium]|jgi:phosphohistidine phosphatase|nr:histidine phosphatase family protein [Gammaproteobacteria bacterium]MBT4492481.1 histidine phosphatase family protein [Gammaproteobacteria bacterium]MBT7372046.1 histidine phosphatase family protein [Gammaproteobacteria bacterium]
MHQLLLLRHAKSSHKDKSLIDFDRPLSKRGRKDSVRIGDWLKDQGLMPELIISSPAKRAQQTVKRIQNSLGIDPGAIQWEDCVYDASVRTLLKTLSEVPEETGIVMLVGHHEGLESMILRMSRWSDIPADPKLIPTAAVAHLEIDGPWSDIRKCKASLKSITRPRNLTRDAKVCA